MGGVQMTIEDIENKLQSNKQLCEIMNEAMNISPRELRSITDYLVESKNRQNLQSIV